MLPNFDFAPQMRAAKFEPTMKGKALLKHLQREIDCKQVSVQTIENTKVWLDRNPNDKNVLEVTLLMLNGADTCDQGVSRSATDFVVTWMDSHPNAPLDVWLSLIDHVHVVDMTARVQRRLAAYDFDTEPNSRFLIKYMQYCRNDDAMERALRFVRKPSSPAPGSPRNIATAEVAAALVQYYPGESSFDVASTWISKNMLNPFCGEVVAALLNQAAPGVIDLTRQFIQAVSEGPGEFDVINSHGLNGVLSALTKFEPKDQWEEWLRRWFEVEFPMRRVRNIFWMINVRSSSPCFVIEAGKRWCRENDQDKHYRSVVGSLLEARPDTELVAMAKSHLEENPADLQMIFALLASRSDPQTVDLAKAMFCADPTSEQSGGLIYNLARYVDDEEVFELAKEWIISSSDHRVSCVLALMLSRRYDAELFLIAKKKIARKIRHDDLVALVVPLLALKPESEIVERARRWLKDNVVYTSINNRRNNVNNEGTVLSALLAVAPDEWLVQRANNWLANKSDLRTEELENKVREQLERISFENL